MQVLYRFQYPKTILDGLSWSADGRYITVAIYDYSLTTLNKSSLNILDTVNGTLTDVTHPLGFDWVAGSQVDWARHSNRIAFNGAKVGESKALWILDLDLMQTSKLIPNSDANGSWSPDDARIVFSKLGTGTSPRRELWTVDVATGVQAFLASDTASKSSGLNQPNRRRF